jgi:methionyl-tRNA synthetase
MGAARYLVTSALPYANGSIHLGHLVEYIQTDIFVRAMRMLGKDIVYICADDTHGTPIEMRASREGIAPEQLVARYHEEHQRDFADFDIRFDFYGSTNQPENETWAVRIFEALRAGGHIEVRDVEQAFCPTCRRFLPDRYVRGTCPNPRCGAADQYGDQCEVCNSTYRPTDLIDPRCAECGATPVRMTTPHYFVKLGDFAAPLAAWTSEPGHLQPETRHFVDGWLSEGLRDWDISRDAPYFGFKIPGEESVYFYVWLDAPVGYISTTERWCAVNGRDVEADYWKCPDAEIHHFIGKDITYFHTLFWPAMLMASELRLPAAVHVHGFLTVNGEKMSKTRGTFINARTYLDHLSPQYLRYYYASKLSGRADDIDLSIEDFTNRVNAELVNKIINLCSRAIQFVGKRLDGRLGTVPAEHRALLDAARARLPEVERAYATLDFAGVVRIACEVADQGNLFFQDQAPFNWIKTDPERARAICTTAVNLCRIIAAVVAPIVPTVSRQVLEMLRVEPSWSDLQRDIEETTLAPFDRILDRLDPKAIEAVIAASTVVSPVEASTKPPELAAETDYETFMKIDLRVARVVRAEAVPKAAKLLRLTLDVGPFGERTVLAGIRKTYTAPEALVGKKLVVVANLAPREMRGEVSQGMILAGGEDESSLKLVELPADAVPGVRIR